MTKSIFSFLVGVLTVCTSFAQGLPSEAAIRSQIQSDAASMTCTEIVRKFSIETAPAVINLMKDSNSKSAEERALSAIVVDEISKQLVIKCAQ